MINTELYNGWIKWNPSAILSDTPESLQEDAECPVDSNSKVEVILRDGSTDVGLASDYDWNHYYSCDMDQYSDDDIIYYKVIEDSSEDSLENKEHFPSLEKSWQELYEIQTNHLRTAQERLEVQTENLRNAMDTIAEQDKDIEILEHIVELYKELVCSLERKLERHYDKW